MKKTIIGIIISTILLIWVFWGVNWGLIYTSLLRVHWPYIFLYIFGLSISQSLRSFRWEFLLRPLQRIGQKTLFPITSVGLLALTIFPARSGELVRPYLLSQKEGIPMSAALATIVIERIMDVISVFIFIIFISFSTKLPKWVFGAGYIAMAFIVAIFLILYLMIAKEPLVLKIAGKIFRPFSDRLFDVTQKFIISFTQGARVLFHWRMMALAFICSILLWTAIALCNYIMFFAFSFPLPLVAAFVLVVIVDLGLMIPAAPGLVGTFQFLFIIGMGIFGVGKEQALSFSILSHALQLLFVGGLGLAFLPMMKIPGFTLMKKVPSP